RGHRPGVGHVRPRRQDRAVGLGPAGGRPPPAPGRRAPGAGARRPQGVRPARAAALAGPRRGAGGHDDVHERAGDGRPGAVVHEETIMTDLALLGGQPAFPEGLPFFRPATPPLERVTARLAPSYERGVLTNGPLVRELEAAAAERLGVPEVVAVASCTAGLMLVFQALARPGTAAVMPSFTFSATAHAARWAGAVPRFAECDAASCQLDVADAATRLEGASVLVGTHVFGAPCAPEEVEKVGRAAGLAVVFDAAHGFGATRAGRPVESFGDAEVFSLSPTKPMTAGEGGLVAVRDPELAARIRLGVDYGNPGDYDTRFAGLNARMSELHAAVALESLAELDEHLAIRRRLAARYQEALAAVPGVRPQAVDPGDASTWKDFTVIVDE